MFRFYLPTANDDLCFYGTGFLWWFIPMPSARPAILWMLLPNPMIYPAFLSFSCKTFCPWTWGVLECRSMSTLSSRFLACSLKIFTLWFCWDVETVTVLLISYLYLSWNGTLLLSETGVPTWPIFWKLWSILLGAIKESSFLSNAVGLLTLMFYWVRSPTPLAGFCSVRFLFYGGGDFCTQLLDWLEKWPCLSIFLLLL